MISAHQRGVVVSILLALVLPHGTPVLAQWPRGLRVEATPHNLTIPASNTDPDMAPLLEDFGEVCVYCHTPHGGSSQFALWNRRTPSGPYRMYDEVLDMVADSQPTGNSLACLSCHDGTIGLDDILELPRWYTGPPPARTSIEECESCHNGGNPDGGINWEGVWLDTDLRKHHPISVIYDPSRDPSFRSIGEVEASGLKLYDGKVQCMTCHEPHSQMFRPFLRVSSGVQSLCLICHQSNPGESTAHAW